MILMYYSGKFGNCYVSLSICLVFEGRGFPYSFASFIPFDFNIFVSWSNFVNTYFWPRCTACGVLVPWPGIEPVPPAVEVRNPNHWTAREFPVILVLNQINCFPSKTSWKKRMPIKYCMLSLKQKKEFTYRSVYGNSNPEASFFFTHISQPFFEFFFIKSLSEVKCQTCNGNLSLLS